MVRFAVRCAFHNLQQFLQSLYGSGGYLRSEVQDEFKINKEIPLTKVTYMLPSS